MCCCICWMLGVIFAQHTQGYPVNVSYFFEGLDCDLGTIIVDPTVLLLVMGTTPEYIIKPTVTPLYDFSPSVDLNVEFVPDEAMMHLLFQNMTHIAMLNDDMVFDDIQWSLLDTLDFSAYSGWMPIDMNTQLIVWTGDDHYFKMRFFEQADLSVIVDFVPLVAASIPEPSLFVLVGSGLLLMIGICKRRSNLFIVVALIFVTMMGTVGLAEAQADTITVTKAEGSGDGTIVYGDTICSPGCHQLTIPYTNNIGVLLKAIPDANSRFIRWKTQDHPMVEGELKVLPGETVIAVFQNKYELFTDDPRFSEPPELYDSTYLRGRYVHLFPEVLLNEDHVILNLFDDVSLTVVRREIEETDRQYLWYGFVQGETWSRVTISISKEETPVVMGSIKVGKLYNIEPCGKGRHAVYELDPTAFEEQAKLLKLPSTGDRRQGIVRKLSVALLKKIVSFFTAETAYAQTPSTINILMLYTRDVSNEINYRGMNINNVIEGLVKDTNDIFALSGINQVRLQLVQTAEVAYQETGNLKGDLDWLIQQATTGGTPISQLRTAHHADFVSLLVATGVCRANGKQAAGIATPTLSGYPGFSVVQWNYAMNNYGLAHELGHNMGADHDRFAGTPFVGRYPYSHGHVFEGQDKCWYTIMAYPTRCDELGYKDVGVNRIRIGYFSNPDQIESITSQPLGIPEGSSYAADNRKTLNNTAAFVAGLQAATFPQPSTSANAAADWNPCQKTPIPEEQRMTWSIETPNPILNWDLSEKTWRGTFPTSDGLDVTVDVWPTAHKTNTGWFANTMKSLTAHGKPVNAIQLGATITGIAYYAANYAADAYFSLSLTPNQSNWVIEPEQPDPHHPAHVKTGKKYCETPPEVPSSMLYATIPWNVRVTKPDRNTIVTRFAWKTNYVTITLTPESQLFLYTSESERSGTYQLWLDYAWQLIASDWHYAPMPTQHEGFNPYGCTWATTQPSNIDLGGDTTEKPPFPFIETLTQVYTGESRSYNYGMTCWYYVIEYTYHDFEQVCDSRTYQLRYTPRYEGEKPILRVALPHR